MKSWIKVMALLAVIFGSPILSFEVRTCSAQTGPSLLPPIHPDKEKKAPAAIQAPTAPAAPAFDGKAVYKESFELFRDLHMLLADPKTREKWEKEWEHKYDNSDAFKTEEGTDKALQELDYSLGQRFDYFFDPERTSDERQQIDATMVGIGATLRLSKMAEIIKTFTKDTKQEEATKALLISQENRLEIDEPIEGSPAEKAGLRPGDVIRMVDGKDLNGMSQLDAIKLIKGKAKTKVTLTIERKNDKDEVTTLDIEITRAPVTIPVVKFKDLGDGVSHVRLRDFMSKNTITEMHAALQKAAKGKALILDLRGNGGGSLTAAITICGMLVEEGPVMVTKYRREDKIVENEIILQPDLYLEEEPDAQGKKVMVGRPRTKRVIPKDMPIIVLIDEGSASASEIVSGCLQHNRRALVVGIPSHGKGVGQSVVQVDGGKRSFHITTFEFIPGRTPNNWYGVIPDVRKERGQGAKEDEQLKLGKELALPMIAQVEKRQADRDAQKKLHEDEFQKVLQERRKSEKKP